MPTRHLEAAVLRQRFEHIVSGGLNLDRLRRADASRIAPVVLVRPEASLDATVLEVRATDRPGLLYLVCEALAELNLSVRSAHVATVGPQAVDVFYVQEPGVGALRSERADVAARAVREPQPSKSLRTVPVRAPVSGRRTLATNAYGGRSAVGARFE